MHIEWGFSTLTLLFVWPQLLLGGIIFTFSWVIEGGFMCSGALLLGLVSCKCNTFCKDVENV